MCFGEPKREAEVLRNVPDEGNTHAGGAKWGEGADCILGAWRDFLGKGPVEGRSWN